MPTLKLRPWIPWDPPEKEEAEYYLHPGGGAIRLPLEDGWGVIAFTSQMIATMKRKQTAKEQGENEHERKWQAEQSDTGYVRIVGEGLRKLMGGVSFCREEELTRAMLLEFLKLQGEVKEVKGLVEVTVKRLDQPNACAYLSLSP